jgi:hypothetical protein
VGANNALYVSTVGTVDNNNKGDSVIQRFVKKAGELIKTKVTLPGIVATALVMKAPPTANSTDMVIVAAPSSIINGVIQDNGSAFGVSPYANNALHKIDICQIPYVNVTPYGRNVSYVTAPDSQGNLYATTSQFGPKGGGTILKMSPQQKSNGQYTGQCTIQVVAAFSNKKGGGGNTPFGAVAVDAAGNVFATLKNTVENSGGGEIVEVSPAGTAKVLHTYAGTASFSPALYLGVDAAGKSKAVILMGTTNNSYTSDTVWQLTVPDSYRIELPKNRRGCIAGKGSESCNDRGGDRWRERCRDLPANDSDPFSSVAWWGRSPSDRHLL